MITLWCKQRTPGKPGRRCSFEWRSGSNWLNLGRNN